jgi:hypothetical protein
MACSGCQKRKEFLMANWKWILIIVAVYLVGVYWPAPGKAVLSKVGLTVA